MLDTPYIFIVGFNKCATQSLHEFFKRNGYSSIHWGTGKNNLAVNMVVNCINGKKVFNGFDHTFSVYSDMHFINNRICIEGNSFFRNMDSDYPNSYFIYNTRNIDKWIESRLSYVNPQGIKLVDRYKSIYQTENIDYIINKWKEQRCRFEQELFEYFSGTSQLLIFNIESESPVKKINDFMDTNLDETAWGWYGKSNSND